MEAEAFISEFCEEFHNLQGLTVGEKKRNLNLLFKKSLNLTDNDLLLSALTLKLQPRTYLEELFYLEFVLNFRCYEAIIKELSNGNNFIIKNISKNSLREILDKKGVTLLFTPFLSHQTTLKLLHRLNHVLNENEADSLFNFLLQTNGPELALKILSRCSQHKIEDTLKVFTVKFSGQELKYLYGKSPNLIIFYFDTHKNEGNEDHVNSNPFFAYIAKHNLDFYQQMRLRYELKVKLSKKSTRNFIFAKKKDLLAKPEIYVPNCHASTIVKTLTKPEFEKIFLKLFPRKIEDCPNSEAARLLHHYPKKKKYEVLVSTYNKIFEKKLEERPVLIDNHILALICDPLEREKLAKLKGKDSDDFLKYYAPDNCLKIVKERINFAREPYERGRLVSHLAKSCLLNEDYEALLRVAKFVAERFKNDNIEVQQNFLKEISSFSKLNEEHWLEINKILARPLPHNMKNYLKVQFFYPYIEFLEKSGSVIEHLTKFLASENFEVKHLDYLKNQDLKKFLLDYLLENASSLKLNEKIQVLDTKLVAASHKFNKENPDKVDIFANVRVFTSLKITMCDENIEQETRSLALQALICSNRPEAEDLRHQVWDNLKLLTPLMKIWFIKKRPDVVAQNIEKFLRFSTKKPEAEKYPRFSFYPAPKKDDGNRKFWKYTRSYSHLSIPEKIIQFCTSSVTKESCEILAQVMPKKEFLALAQNYFGSTPLATQDCFLKNLKNKDCVNFILQICGTKEFVPLCVGPLVSALYRTPKSETVPKLEAFQKTELWEKVIQNVEPFLDRKSILKIVEEKEDKSALLLTLKYFLNNPSNESWRILKVKLDKTENFDKVAARVIAKKKPPKQFFAEYFEKIWKILEKSNEACKFIVLKQMHKDTVTNLKPQFLYSLVTKLEFEKIENTICVYLVFSKPPNKETLFEKMFQAWGKDRKKLRKLTRKIFEIFMNEKCEENTVNIFLSKLKKYFPFAQIPESYIMLHLLKLKNQKVQKFSMQLIELHQRLINKYGESVTIILKDVLNEVLHYFCKNNPDLYEFLYLLVKNRKSFSDAILAIKLLPLKSEPEDKASNKYFENILTEIEEIKMPVQLYINLYFKNRKVETETEFEYYQPVNNFCINSSSWICPGAKRRATYCFM